MKKINISIKQHYFSVIVKDNENFAKAKEIMKKQLLKLKQIGYDIDLFGNINNRGSSKLDQYNKLKEGSILDNNRRSVNYNQILIKGGE